MKRNKKAFLQISFAWIFAFIVGAFILGLTIFALTRFIGSESRTGDLTTAKEISVLLDPLETSFEEGKITTIETTALSRIYSNCSLKGDFGYQEVKVNKEVYGKWTDTEDPIKTQNKYLFMENPAEGEKFIVFTKPFYFPFKVASLIYLIPDNESYCFKGPPEQIEKELVELNHPQIFVDGSDWDCSGNETNVCFGYSNDVCDINVDMGNNWVVKDNNRSNFIVNPSGTNTKDYSLLYAAIFSDKDLYECQTQRLVNRTLSLAELYEKKLLLPSLGGCNDRLLSDLRSFEGYLSSYNKHIPLTSMSSISESIYLKNKNNYVCKLW